MLFKKTLLFLLLLPTLVSGQHKLVYDIHWFGKVGTLQIQQIQNQDSVIITTNSEVKVPFYKFNWITTTSQKSGKFLSSSYAQLLNDNKKEYTDIRQDKPGNWRMTNDLGSNELIDVPYTFLVSMLYFKEPRNERMVFSERFAKGLTIENLGSGRYKLLLPDGNFCEYFYENGVCVLVKAKNGTRTIKMTLAEKS